MKSDLERNWAKFASRACAQPVNTCARPVRGVHPVEKIHWRDLFGVRGLSIPARDLLGFRPQKSPVNSQTTPKFFKIASRPLIIKVFCLIKKNEHGKCVLMPSSWNEKFMYICFKKCQSASKARVLFCCSQGHPFHAHFFPTAQPSPLSFSPNLLTKNIKVPKPYLLWTPYKIWLCDGICFIIASLNSPFICIFPKSLQKSPSLNISLVFFSPWSSI